MELKLNNTLRIWQEESSRAIPKNFEIFQNLVSKARSFEQSGKYEMAAIYADIADEYASWTQHCGLFTSPNLEHILLNIGQKAIESSSLHHTITLSSKSPRRVLHVVDTSWIWGGHSRFLWRWIQQDAKRSHSVVFTRMSIDNTPDRLRDAVIKSRGKLYELKEIGFISRAKELRKIAAPEDIVVLHTLHDATISHIAFANKDQSPPIIYINHADERFWIGAYISDIVANLRESGMRLSQKRRGIETERNAILPIIIEPARRVLSRLEAKQKIGIDENSVMILSISRAVKYKSIDKVSFADVHIPLLQKYDQAILVVIGPGNNEDWSAAIQSTKGRIRVLGETSDTGLFYQAADIYVDSFPFVSNTSLLEAGSYGMPLVSRYPYYSDDCEIFGADMIGLTGNLICAQNIEEYRESLSHLIEDREFRISLGERTKKCIEDVHIGNNWQQSLEDIYVRASTLPRVNIESLQQDQISTEEPDAFLQKIFSFTGDKLDSVIQHNVRLMPLNRRFSFWLKQLRNGNFGRAGNISFLLPEWLYRILSKPFKF